MYKCKSQWKTRCVHICIEKTNQNVTMSSGIETARLISTEGKHCMNMWMEHWRWPWCSSWQHPRTSWEWRAGCPGLWAPCPSGWQSNRFVCSWRRPCSEPAPPRTPQQLSNCWSGDQQQCNTTPTPDPLYLLIVLLSYSLTLLPSLLSSHSVFANVWLYSRARCWMLKNRNKPSPIHYWA